MNYHEFHNLFLIEMPRRINGGNPYEPLCQGIDVTIEYGGDIESLGDDVYKVGDFYWVGSGDGSVKQICCNVSHMGTLAKVNTTGKNPELIGQPPYAADFYLKISQALNTGIKFASDQILSDDGFKVWSKLLNHGHKILVFNNHNGKYVPVIVNSIDQLSHYFNDDGHIYQYVLDEGKHIGNLFGTITLMEWKRLANYPLPELFVKT